MKLYSRYIFNKTLAGFAAFITILISLIWFSRAISFVRYVTENGVELSKFFSLFLLILPWLLLFIIPVSLFAAVLMIYNRLIGYNEITILKNSGLTNLQICKPILPLALACTTFCYLLSFYLMPFANKELRLSRIDFKNNYASLAFTPQTFETMNNLTIYTRGRDENNNLVGILLHDERPQKYSMTITAKSGHIVTEDRSALLYMESGTVQRFNYDTAQSEILNFDNYVFNLTESQKNNDKMRWKAKERYLHELLNPQDEEDIEEAEKFNAEIHQRFTYPLLPLIFSMIALSCILRGQFSRNGNSFNILLAIFMSAIFLGITLLSYDLIESSKKFIPLLYLNFIVFFAISFQILTSNPHKKS